MTGASYYKGDGVARDLTLPEPPPWRTFPRRSLAEVFQPPAGLVDAVNAALCLRRPLLVTGAPGSGKSTIIDSVAVELKLGTPLRWHVTSQSTLSEALYRYDVLGRIHAHQLGDSDDIAPFLQLGPLGTALMPTERPRALLIDEIDKSDLDLPSDLLNVLERGEYEIPELARHTKAEVRVQEWGGGRTHTIARGRVQCTEFPFIVITNNGERDFPPPFLRRCVRFSMPPLDDTEMLKKVVRAHLNAVDIRKGPVLDLINDFARRVGDGEVLAVDQLLGAAYLLSNGRAPAGARRENLMAQLLRELNSA